MASVCWVAATAAVLASFVQAGSLPSKRSVPTLAQVINQKSFNVLPSVPPASDYNASSVSIHPVLL